MPHLAKFVRLGVALLSAAAIAGCAAIGCNDDEAGGATDQQQMQTTVISVYSPADGEIDVLFAAPIYVSGNITLQTSQGEFPVIGSPPQTPDQASSELTFNAAQTNGSIEISGLGGGGTVTDVDGGEVPLSFDETYTVTIGAAAQAASPSGEAATGQEPEPTATPLPARRVIQLVPAMPTPMPNQIIEFPVMDPNNEGRFPGLAEVVSISIETNENMESWFILSFDQPVTTSLPEDTHLVVHQPPTTAEINEWTYVELPLATSPAMLPDGLLDLAFGPILVEGSYAVEVSKTINDMEGNAILDGFQPVRFTPDRAIGAPIDPNLNGCVAVLERRNVSGVIINAVRNTLIEDLADADRIDWRTQLTDEFGADLTLLINIFQPIIMEGSFDPLGNEIRECRDLWSQNVTAENSTKRNAVYSYRCLSPLGWSDPAAPWSFRSDALDLAGRPYNTLTPTERMTLRLLLDISEPPNPSTQTSPCRLWYPQLFYGRWIPIQTVEN